MDKVFYLLNTSFTSGNTNNQVMPEATDFFLRRCRWPQEANRGLHGFSQTASTLCTTQSAFRAARLVDAKLRLEHNARCRPQPSLLLELVFANWPAIL